MLDTDGPDKFIRHCEKIALLTKGRCRRESESVPIHTTITFRKFIRIIYKYTKSMRSKVALTVEIQKTDDKQSHILLFSGIRDRTKGGSKKLIGHRRGHWILNLEAALRKGIVEDQIRDFRKHFMLRKEDGEPDSNFFTIRHPPII